MGINILHNITTECMQYRDFSNEILKRFVYYNELKYTRMGEFNSDEHHIYKCGPESLRRNGVTLIVTKRV